MAKTTYTGANVAPTTDTFSEWVDLTNRITYDMSDVVITVADVSQQVELIMLRQLVTVM